MAIRRGRSFRAAGPRRLTSWSASTPASVYTVFAASSSILLDVFTPTVERQTVVRIRGIFCYRSDQISATETVLLSLGIGIVEEPAAAIGITAIPTPGAEADSELWMYHQYMSSRFVFITGVGYIHNDVTTVQVDSKAMRKMDGTQRLVVVVQNQGTSGASVLGQFRILTKLS